jgi:hypothetical protein
VLIFFRKNIFRQVLFLAFGVLLVGFILGCAQSTPAPSSQKKWTVMLFAAGDNDLESYIFTNINQLELVGSSSQVNFVAEADWWHHCATTETMVTGEGVGRYYIEYDTDVTRIKSPLVESMEEINTGTAEAVQNFVSWAVQNYPADHYMLIISSHGSGWRGKKTIEDQGFGQDYTTDATRGLLITLEEFKAIMPSIYSTLGNRKLEILAIDCCLNGMIDVGYQVKDYVDWLVASEQTIPGTGYPYTNIATNLTSNPNLTAEALAINIVDLYYNQYYLQDNTTLSLVDLSKIGAVADSVKNLVPLFDSSTKLDTFKDLIDNHTGEQYLIQRYHDVTFRDIWDMADKIIENTSGSPEYASITAECAALKTAVEGAVVTSKYTTAEGTAYSVADSHGISIYVPTSATTSYESDYGGLDFSTYTGWGTFLQSIQ